MFALNDLIQSFNLTMLIIPEYYVPCIAPLSSRFYYPETRRFINAFIIIIIYYLSRFTQSHSQYFLPQFAPLSGRFICTFLMTLQTRETIP